MEIPPDILAIQQRLMALQQRVRELGGSPEAAAVQAEFDAFIASLRAQGVVVVSQSTDGGVNLGIAPQIGAIDTMVGRDQYNAPTLVIGSLQLPAPPTPARPFSQVPPPVGDFIGREDELKLLIEALTAEQRAGVAAISGVRGLGGLGKTELARKVADRIAGHFPDGVLLVELFGSRSEQSRAGAPRPLTPEEALGEVLQWLRPREQLPSELHRLRKLFHDTLRGKRVLILADDAGNLDQVEPLVPPHGSALLITSRVSFKLGGMVVLPLEGLPEAQAVALLSENCQRVGEAEAKEIARLCGYLPLALRISANLLSNNDDLPVARYNAEGALVGGYLFELARERKRLEMLRDPDEARRSPPEQRSYDVEASLMLSYQQLTFDEQAAFRCLGVFAARFDTRAANAVMAEEGQIPDEEWLRRLRRYHLLNYNSETERYSLHELVRVFALARLADAGPEVEYAARMRYARHYTRAVAKVEQLFLQGDGGVVTRPVVFTFRLNLSIGSPTQAESTHSRASDELAQQIDKTHAVDHPQEATQTNPLLSPAPVDLSAIQDTYTVSGPALLRSLLERERQSLSLVDIHVVPEQVHAKVRKGRRYLVGYLLATAQLLALDIPTTNALLAAYVQPLLSQLHQRADPLLNQLLAYWLVKDALFPFSGEQTDIVSLGELVQHAFAQLGVKIIVQDRQIDEYAQKYLRASVFVNIFELAKEISNRKDMDIRLRHARYYINEVYRAEKRYRSGSDGVRDALTIFDQERSNLDVARIWLQQQMMISPNTEIASLLIADADATANIGDLRYSKSHETLPQLKIALHSARFLWNRTAQGRLLSNIGLVLQSIGDIHRTSTLYEQSLVIAHENNDKYTQYGVLCNLGNTYLVLGEPRYAITLYEQSLGIAHEHQDKRSQGMVLGSLGSAYFILGKLHQAIVFYKQSLAIAQEFGDRQHEGIVLGNLGNAHLILGELQQAITFYEESLAIARELGDRQNEGYELGNLGTAYFILGQPDQAIPFYEQSLIIARELGNKHSDADTIWNLGLALLQGDRSSEIRSIWSPRIAGSQEDRSALVINCLEQGLAFYQEIGHPRAVTMAETVAYVCKHGTLPVPRKLPVLSEELPEGVRTALEQQNDQAFEEALKALPQEERAQVEQVLMDLAAAIEVYVSRSPLVPAERDTDEAVQLLPLLGDIALGAHGDADARALAEAALPLMEQNGWQLAAAARRIWAGERDMAALTTGIDAKSAALVRRVLVLLAEGPDLIFAANSLQIARLRRQADDAVAQALLTGDTVASAALAQQLAETAQQAEQQPGAPWQALADYLRRLVERLAT